MYFDQGQDFNPTTELFEKVQYSRNQAIKSSLNEGILLMQYMKLYFQDKTLCLSGNQDLTLNEGDSNFNAQSVEIPHFERPLTCKQAR